MCLINQCRKSCHFFGFHLSFRQIWVYLITGCSALGLYLFFLQFYFTPPFVSFQDISRVLVLRSNTNHTLEQCIHNLEKQIVTDKIEAVMNVTKSDLETLTRRVLHGGSWSPLHCISKYQVNIIVPYRNRQNQLQTFLHYFHRFLPLQEIDFRIIVVEQTSEKRFNRGKLFNIGFVEMEKRFPADCYIFHDVDLIPTSLNNMYACTIHPRHMSSALDIFNYQLPYARIFGGAVALTRQQFQLANGYSNLFFGWGGEDDDFYERVTHHSPIMRFHPSIAQYIMLNHSKEIPNPNRFKILQNGRYHYSTEGLNSLRYTLSAVELRPLYTWLLVKV